MKLVVRLLQANDGDCFHCGKKIRDRDSLTLDHLLARSKGGVTKRGNVVPCCWECNQKRRNQIPDSQELEDAEELWKKMEIL